MTLADKYNLSEASRMMGIRKFGRNKAYRILRERGIVDEWNKPYEIYLQAGLLALGSPRSYFYRYVTLVVGKSGLKFLERVVVDYLQYHPMPTFPRIKRIIYEP